jgi:hypothetical protein
MKQPEISTFRPRMRVLNEEQAWAIHHAALEILEHTGFVLEQSQVKQMLLAAGCRLDPDGRLLMPASLVESALKTAPRQITLYDQSGRRTMPLVNGNFYFGTGSDTIFTIDLETGERRPHRASGCGQFRPPGGRARQHGLFHVHGQSHRRAHRGNLCPRFRRNGEEQQQADLLYRRQRRGHRQNPRHRQSGGRR